MYLALWSPLFSDFIHYNYGIIRDIITEAYMWYDSLFFVARLYSVTHFVEDFSVFIVGPESECVPLYSSLSICLQSFNTVG